MTNFFYNKSIFVNDILCMLVIIFLIIKNQSSIKKTLENFNEIGLETIKSNQDKWNKNSLIIILSIVLITTSVALIQVTLP